MKSVMIYDHINGSDPPHIEYWAHDGNYFIINPDGTSVRHREDGPAIEHLDGRKEWYYEGKRLPSQNEFEKFLKLKAFW